MNHYTEFRWVSHYRASVIRPRLVQYSTFEIWQNDRIYFQFKPGLGFNGHCKNSFRFRISSLVPTFRGIATRLGVLILCIYVPNISKP